MLPALTHGSINRILNGEDVAGTIIQILGYKRIPGENDRYRLLISDGVTAYSFAMLGIAVYHLLANKQLEKFTIVSLDKYLMAKVKPECKVIILLNLTVLTSGADVGKKLGSPVNPFSVSFTNAIDSSNNVKKRTASEMIDSEQQRHATSLPTLTSGSIIRIVNGADVSEAIIQILSCKKMPYTVGNDRYRLRISDGVNVCPFVMLGTQLNHLVTNKELEQFTVVSVNKYVMNEVQPERKVIILLNLTVLTPGADVGRKLGSPVDSYSSPFTNRTDSLNHAKKQRIGSEQIVYPALTSGYINHVFNWKDISGAVIQILSFKLIPTSAVVRYQLLISDGVTASSFGLLSTRLNSLIINKELEKFAIIRVDKYICIELLQGLKVIILFNIAVLVPGAYVSSKLGNPVQTSPIDDLTQPLDEIVCNFATLNI